ncbi:RidA family protein [Novosphingobium sp.]|jgi:2-iminobutanoate/2-iminopropanoate deaminase|uniref:RidA family protein n=1 Tax=Novosphingobium sp. TaxID=1874826 RepID=UPI0022BE1B17|nr:RidA family protein [Novosphingobium sp.]MCZ8018664.1 RidA family protein [Novosphingobium sp.]MCZ8034669.1 RidA family protein [Novosphingobium sp.]MCZ8052804.1 RidA family protein [Novosphingobium sp.]MCZ8060562.1 RidA family protein [Novosphingobium sp.]MCZ8230588.1 RidA family protein [Novosphingobium sp.]
MSDRKSIVVEGFGHGKLPIPAASRIGPFVASGNIFGFDYTAGAHPDTAEEQAALMFNYVRLVIEGAGGTLDDILKITVYIRNDSVRAAIDQHWLEAFPHEASRPARQAILLEAMPGNRLVACDFLAVID